MHKGLSQGKKVIKRREEDKLFEGHLERIRNARPSTTGYALQDIPRGLNSGKKNMLNEDKFTEIERENRILLEKISTTMNKRAQSVSERDRNNKSLHGSFRRKQLENIEIENARLLKRLQEKKSDYKAEKMDEEWKKQKAVIKNIANYPLIIKDKTSARRERKRGFSKPINLEPMSSLGGAIELMRLRNIDGINMIVTVKLDQRQLTIIGDLKMLKTIKIIQIPRQQALEFIEHECDGKIQNIFDRLRYQEKEGVLYLLSDGADYEDAQQNKVE